MKKNNILKYEGFIVTFERTRDKLIIAPTKSNRRFLVIGVSENKDLLCLPITSKPKEYENYKKIENNNYMQIYVNDEKTPSYVLCDYLCRFDNEQIAQDNKEHYNFKNQNKNRYHGIVQRTKIWLNLIIEKYLDI